MKFEDLDQDSQERMIKHWKQFEDENAKGFVKTYQKIYNEQYEKLRKTNQRMNESRSQMNDIGVRIHNRRLDLGKTVENIAELTGLSKAKIRKYENGITSTITADELVLLAIALDTTPNLLAGWYDMDFPEEDE